jgi:DNA replication and repair protein RecF
MSQRNALLKYFALNHVFENDTLTIYNEQLTSYGIIFSRKEKNLSQPRSYFQYHHHAITGSAESVQLVYDSHLFEKMIYNAFTTKH